MSVNNIEVQNASQCISEALRASQTLFTPPPPLKNASPATLDVTQEYETKIRKVFQLMANTFDVVRRYGEEIYPLKETLKNHLARQCHMRKKDFEGAVHNLFSNIRQQEVELKKAISEFQAREEQTLSAIREVLLSPVGSDSGVRHLWEELFILQKAQTKNIACLLKNYQLSLQELLFGLKKILTKGDKVNLRDLKVLLKVLQEEQDFRKSAMGRIWEELWALREEVAQDFRNFMLSGGLTTSAAPTFEEKVESA